jgi:hypothetical protein
MAPPIERWARQAVDLERLGDFRPVAPGSVMADLDAAKALQRQTWKERQRRLVVNGEPVALEGVYAGLNAYPPAGDLAAVTLGATENGFWSSSLFTPIPANGILAPEAYRIAATGNLTTPAGTQTMTITPRMGTTNAGITLGASAALSLTASITASFWYIVGDLTMRSVGAPGANSTAIGLFHFVGTNAAGAGAVSYNIIFGQTVATFDASVASGLWIGATTATTTGQTLTTRQVHWMSWN